MINLLMLIVFSANLKSAWYEGPKDKRHKARSSSSAQDPRRKQDLGNHKQSRLDDMSQADQKHAIQQSFMRRSSTTYHQNPLIIHVPAREESVDLSIVNLRGQLEAQNLDEQRTKSCWERLVAICTGSRKIRGLTPPPLVRTDSYFPGRGQSPSPFSDYITHNNPKSK